MFDEKRYFRAGTQPTVFERKGFRIGLLVCEDIWEPSPAQLARDAGAELLVVINASPFEMHKQREREDRGPRARAGREAAGRVREPASAGRTSWCSTATRS